MPPEQLVHVGRDVVGAPARGEGAEEGEGHGGNEGAVTQPAWIRGEGGGEERED